MKLVSIVGARPQFIKIAPLSRALAQHNEHGDKPIVDIIIHTGQHYDANMSHRFFEDLKLPREAVNLGVGSGHHGSQTGQMLEKIEQVLLDTRPDMVVIYGDTNSTVAGALAAAKLHIPVAHVEAGVRSFNRRMPEEINRVVADHTSDLLLAPTPTAMANLKAEGLASKAMWTGDVMYDAVLAHRQLAQSKKAALLKRFHLTPAAYGLVTLHRAENTDDPARLRKLLSALSAVASDVLPLVFPIHPRTAKQIASKLATWSPHPRLHLIDPVGYLDMLCLVQHARMTLTDSGGLQKEAFFLGCPCMTLREETEWLETVQAGGNALVGVEPERIYSEVLALQRHAQAGAGTHGCPASLCDAFGDGRAANKIKEALLAFLQ